MNVKFNSIGRQIITLALIRGAGKFRGIFVGFVIASDFIVIE
jgi:hypothetical protein